MDEPRVVRRLILRERSLNLVLMIGVVGLLALIAKLTVGEELGIKLRSDLSRAIHRRDFGEVRLLLLLGVNPGGRTAGVHPPLMAAIKLGDVELTRQLIASGADLNPYLKSGDAPLCLARRLRLTEIVSLLAAHGASCSGP